MLRVQGWCSSTSWTLMALVVGATSRIAEIPLKVFCHNAIEQFTVSRRWPLMAYHIDQQSNRPHALAESWRERASRQRIGSWVRPGGRNGPRGLGNRAPRSQRR